MTDKNKIIAAFLISAGLFSAAQAMKYIETLSAKDKNALMLVAGDKSVQILVAAGSEVFTEEGKKTRTT